MVSSAKAVVKAYTGLKRGRKKKSFLLTHKKGRRATVSRPFNRAGERENDGDYQDDEGFIDGDEDYGWSLTP